MTRQSDARTRLSGFTLIEVLLALALLAMVGTVSLSILPAVTGEPGGNPSRVDRIVRGAMVEALVTDRNILLEAEGDELRYMVDREILDSESFSGEVRITSPESGRSTDRVLISADGLHRAFEIAVGDEDPIPYEPRLRFP